MLKKMLVGVLGLFILSASPISATETQSTEAVATAATISKVDINTATEAVLDEELIGIGPKKAAAIIKYRAENGLFKSIEELKHVPGIGEKLFLNNRDKLIASQPVKASKEAGLEAEKVVETTPPATPASDTTHQN
ncbi:competence protein ComEA-like protein with helix-hairpin-helix repeat region [Beggiatoa alba B18LD]|uniref:Competence protein ComEA-like protein with helix-hairpin-helix repeat region n=1 Tax=Beggiatoa alba B18LD TaxID=395493 RepID=I3CGM4_9GAMM|nr:helix-hairpin-helix domain-containing protein [Beggiatoa alba]EIJ42767.1 competence protein ComEA-like protein with helix-hairpin-helix repeat region [Beggiatoa alba B18LD]